MPIIRNTEDWEKVFRKQVRSIADGWTVRESPRGKKVMLKVRTDRGQSITLDFLEKNFLNFLNCEFVRIGLSKT